MAAKRPAVHGLLLVDKPRGLTSHDVVALVRRVAGQREVGHAGTLDPLATGLLALGLGQGTRVLEYLSGHDKTYEARLRLGLATDTYDAEGAPVREAPWEHVTADQVRTVLCSRFSGDILQRPPAYSAIKRAGVPLYRLARRGAAVSTDPRPVTISRVRLERFAPPELDLTIECSSGTYVRSLVHDLGETLGSAAHLAALRRTRIGRLTLDESVSCAELTAGGVERLLAALLALDRPLLHLPALILHEGHVSDLLCGRAVAAPPATATACRAYDAEGRFLALMRQGSGAWLPHKVLAARPSTT